MGRAIGVTELLAKKYKELPFCGEWAKCMGLPSVNFKCIVWGNSRNGKTDFITKFCKMLASLNIGKVAVNSIEEGDSRSLQIAWQRNNMEEVAGNIILLDKEPVGEMIKRVKKSRAIKFLVLDSIQMARMSKEQYDELVKAAGKRLALIFISHASGKEPKGAVAGDIMYDADIKIFVEGFRADVASRFGGNHPFIIWKDGAEKYWGASLYVTGKQTKKQVNNNQIPMGI